MFKKIMTLLALCCLGMLESNVKAALHELPGSSPDNPVQLKITEELYNQMVACPSVYAWLSTMHAGKTNTCARLKEIAEQNGKTVTSIRLLPEGRDPAIQNGRESDKKLGAQPISYGWLTGYFTKQLLNPSTPIDLIIVDESHFGRQDDFSNAIKYIKSQKTSVFITGLRLDIYKKEFPVAEELQWLANAEQVTFVGLPSQAFCCDCNALAVDLFDTRTINGILDAVPGKHQVVIPEGSDNTVEYLTLCTSCLQHKEKEALEALKASLEN
jgi:thymidine kinase